MLIVEDGTCIIDADSYITVEEVSKVAAQFGNVTWAGLTIDTQEIACRVGSAYVDSRYAECLTGQPQCSHSILEWPRKDAVMYTGGTILDNTIPLSIKRAAIEAALLHASGVVLLPNIEGGPNLTSKSVANGAISKSWDKDSYGNMPVFKKIEALLYSTFGPSPNSKRGINSVPIRRGV